MTHPAYTDHYLSQRRFYLALPILALPFLTFIYWKLVVKNLENRPKENARHTGLQLSLPSADFTGEQHMDKLAYYTKADQDSASWAQQIKKDPYRQGENAAAVDSTTSALMGLSGPEKKVKHIRLMTTKPQTPQERQVHQRLLALDKALSTAQTPSFKDQPPAKNTTIEVPPEISRLEKMITQMQNESVSQTPDQEMNQLDGMLDKLMQLQQQENTKGNPNEPKQTKQPPALPVNALSSDDQISLLAPGLDSSALPANHVQQTGFYGLEEQEATNSLPGFSAVIEHTGQLVSGNTVQLRLTSALSVAGTAISENTFVYGVASLSGERLKIKISSLRSGEQILPVNLSVYDLDGIEGIYIPGALSRSVAKQQLGSQVQGYDLDVDGISMGAQAASTGIQMGKMLLSRKTKLTQVTIRQGYKVILYDANTTHQQD